MKKVLLAILACTVSTQAFAGSFLTLQNLNPKCNISHIEINLDKNEGRYSLKVCENQNKGQCRPLNRTFTIKEMTDIQNEAAAWMAVDIGLLVGLGIPLSTVIKVARATAGVAGMALKGAEALLGKKAKVAFKGTDLRIRGADGKLMVLKGHTANVQSAVELTDGRIVSAAADKTLRIWKPKPDGSYESIKLVGPTNSVKSISELKDGRILSVDSAGGKALWAQKADGTYTLSKVVETSGAVVSGWVMTALIFDLVFGSNLQIANSMLELKNEISLSNEGQRKDISTCDYDGLLAAEKVAVKTDQDSAHSASSNDLGNLSSIGAP